MLNHDKLSLKALTLLMIAMLSCTSLTGCMLAAGAAAGGAAGYVAGKEAGEDEAHEEIDEHHDHD